VFFGEHELALGMIRHIAGTFAAPAPDAGPDFRGTVPPKGDGQ